MSSFPQGGSLCSGSGSFTSSLDEAHGFDAMEGFSSRGRFTCYHGEADKRPPHSDATLKDREKIEKSMKQFYVEAARRLPLAQTPELADCIRTGGHCIGLADPVSNIILNAIRRLSPPSPSASPPLERSGRTAYWERDMGLIATKSHFGLLFFMADYFRYITDTQARRYLFLASYDLSVAIKLVHHERFSSNSQRPLLPDGGKIKAALRIAALKAGHPAPDDLGGLMTAQYPSALLSPVMDKLQGDKLLSTGDVWDISNLLACQWPPKPPVKLEFLCRPNGDTCTRGNDDSTLLRISACMGESLFAQISITSEDPSSPPQPGYISDLTFDCAYMETKLSKCLSETMTDSQKCGATVNYDDAQCDHKLSLKMCLLDTIHTLYIKALAILPINAWGSCFLRALLVAGHCYGPLDPVSNIILSSRWYDIAFPPLEAPEKDRIEAQCGILDTSSMSRMESRTLNGLIAILRTTSRAPLSEHEALEYLYFWNCDLSRLCTERACNDIPFDSAAKAAKHPQCAAFGSFLMSLSPQKLTRLRSLLPVPAGERISQAHWDQLTVILQEESVCNVVLSARKDETPCCLSQEASLEMSRKNSAFRDKLTFVHMQLSKMLRKYCNQHPWEPNYQLDIICGVHVKSMSFSERKSFHANFLVSSDDAAASRERTLFFAEVVESPLSEVQSELSILSSSCCPIYDYHACIGRCPICEDVASKIVHPPSGSNIGGSIGRYISLYRSALHRVCNIGFEGMLESDYIYFDHYRDVELGKIINDFNKERPYTSMRSLNKVRKPN